VVISTNVVDNGDGSSVGNSCAAGGVLTEMLFRAHAVGPKGGGHSTILDRRDTIGT
jgi:hypothetical protein